MGRLCGSVAVVARIANDLAHDGTSVRLLGPRSRMMRRLVYVKGSEGERIRALLN